MVNPEFDEHPFSDQILVGDRVLHLGALKQPVTPRAALTPIDSLCLRQEDLGHRDRLGAVAVHVYNPPTDLMPML